MKKLLLAILLVPVLANAQLQNYLTGSTPKTHRELQGSPTATTRLDTIIHSITIVLDSTISSLQRYGLNTGNYSTIAAGLSDARSNRAPLIVPYDWTGGSPAPTTADSNVTIFDYRFGSFGFTGKRHWGFKSAWEVDSLTRFIKVYDSVRTQGRLSLAEGTWALDSLHIDRAISIQGTNATRIRPVDVAYGGSMLKSSNNTGRDLLTISAPGVNLSDLTLHGNSRLNGHGVLASRRPNASGVITTTLGGYSLRRVNSAFHGGNGIHLRGADGIILHDIETYGNGGFGIAIVSPSFDSASSAGNTAGGTTNIVFGGRSRANGQGGILSADQAATLLLGAEAIADTGYAVWFNDGRSRGGSLWGDFELNVPPRVPNPVLTAVRIDNHNAFMMMNSYVGTKHTFGTFTADAGTNSTTIVDAALVNYGPNDWLTGSDIVNTSRSSARRRITDYDAATGTLTLASAITGQTTGDTYIMRKYLNRAIHLDSLSSGIFINNNIDHESDTSMAVTGYAYITAFNNVNFDPADDVKAIGGATVKWFNYNLSKVDSLSGGDARFTSNTEVQFITSDSLILRTTGATTGISLDALDKLSLIAKDVVQLQPNADSHVYLFDNAQDEERQDLRIYGDADLNVGSLNRQYIRFAFSSATENALTVANSADSIYFGLASPMLISGDNGTERRIEFVNHTGGTTIPTPTNGRVSLYTRGDTLYAKDDGGVERSLYAAAGASGDITGVNAGNGLIGGGTTGDVTLRADTTDTFRWLGPHFFIKDGDTLKLNLATELYPIDLEINNSRVWAVDSIGLMNLADGVTQTFNPNGTSAGLNVGSQAGDPSAPVNGDLWYDGTANELTARINGANVALGAGGGSGISTATARANTGWTSNGTTATDTLARSYILDKANLQVHFVDADNDSVSFVPQSLYPINYKDATTQLWAVDSTGAMALADGVKQTFNPNGTTAGLNFGSQAGNPSSLANGDVWYNSTTGKLMGREGGVSYPIVNDYDPSTTFAIYDDFITGSANTSGAMGSANWQRTIATSGTTTHQDGEAGRPGIMQLFCANSAGSTAALHSHTSSFKLSGADYYKGSVKFSTLGTAGSNGALYRFGWADGVTTSYPSNGAWIEFNVDSSATRWRAITSNGGTRTITTYTGSTVSATTWYKLEILTNSNASSVDFSVDGTVIATHTTNIPTSNGIGALMMAGAVTASATKNAVVDYVLYMQSNLSR